MVNLISLIVKTIPNYKYQAIIISKVVRINFYAGVFKKEIAMLSRFKDMPPSDDFKVEEKDLDKVMYSVLNISDNLVLMAADDVIGMSSAGNTVGLSVNFTSEESLEEAERIFNELSENGNVLMPWGKTFWEAYYGKFIDQFGIAWEINYQL